LLVFQKEPPGIQTNLKIWTEKLSVFKFNWMRPWLNFCPRALFKIIVLSRCKLMWDSREKKKTHLRGRSGKEKKQSNSTKTKIVNPKVTLCLPNLRYLKNDISGFTPSRNRLY
jgi:hypothetical protein